MIIQCDHCAARFRMDDSKLANGPVKVRCAKCKEVFIVQPENTPDETAAPVVPEQAPPSADSGETSDFSFDAPSSSSASFSGAADDFSFDVETPPVSKPSDAEPTDEFDWQGGAATPASAGAGSEFDLSSFEASLATSGQDAATSQSGDGDFDFGDVDLSAPQAQSSPGQSADAAADSFSMDFGEVSFSDHPAEPADSTDSFAEPSLEKPVESSGFSENLPEPSSSDDFLLSFSPEAAPQEQPPAAGKPEPENVNFGEFSFGDMGETAVTESKSEPAVAMDQFSGGFAESAPVHQFEDEELPPTSLTTRKKSGSLFPVSVIGGAIILVIILAGSGAYFFGGPKVFSKVGLGFLVDKGADEGSITLKGVTASYVVNSLAGELFVVRGEAVNNFKKPRASVQIKVTLVGSGGTALASKSAFCGNPLSSEQLTKLPLAKIEESMSNPFGDSLVNLGLKPGDSIPFVVVVSPVPKEATDYSVVVGGSTVAAQ